MASKKEPNFELISENNILKKLSVWRMLRRFLFLFYFLALGAVIGFHVYYADRVLPNVYLNNKNVGGKTLSELNKIIEDQTTQPITVDLKVKDYSRRITQDEINFQYLKQATVKKVFAVGRNPNSWISLKEKLLSFFDRQDISYEYKYDEEQLKVLITLVRIESLKAFEEPHYALNGESLIIVEGKSGETFDEQKVKNTLMDNFMSLKSGEVNVEVVSMRPTLVNQDLENQRAKMQNYLDTKYVFKYQDKEWPLQKNDILMIFKPIKKTIGSELVIDDSYIIDRLNTIADEINRNPRAQVLEVQNGRAIKFESSLTGLTLDVDKTLDAVKQNLIDQKPDLELSVQESKAPQVKNDFEIVDVIGVGKSTFKGSDAGRVKNIQTAVSKIDGVIVAPGEVFSFLKAVGPVDRENGFGPAKVISGGRTVLGDGGGVCQVSTTVFRAALNSGLPILERNAHSYRVGYYEQGSPPGIDATIFYPSVDFQFKNDTEGYILIDAELDTKKMTLNFVVYGKSDGRKVEVSTPQILNKIGAPATVYIEDPNMPKGSKKQLEYSVGGATVVFTRKVTKDDKVLADDTFKSVYRAWGAVIAVGTKE
ncbi:MAG: hypothetical protein E6Q58_04270 [Niabella sp.]|nr:MAG: hypothetical protein E6Q58_04270 [Niabella sp.]